MKRIRTDTVWFNLIVKMMKKFDYSDTVQSNTATTPEQEKLHLLQSCVTRQYLTCGVSVVSDPSNCRGTQIPGTMFPRQLNFVWLCLIFTVQLFQSFFLANKNVCQFTHWLFLHAFPQLLPMKRRILDYTVRLVKSHEVYIHNASSLIPNFK